MWATLRACENNNLDGMTLTSSPKCGQTLHRSWARKHQSAITSISQSLSGVDSSGLTRARATIGP